MQSEMFRGVLAAIGLTLGLAACNSGGGGSKPAPVAPNAVAAKLAVSSGAADAVLVTAEPPKSTLIDPNAAATSQPPALGSDEDPIQEATGTHSADLDLNIEATDGLSAILARVSGAPSYFQINESSEPAAGPSALRRKSAEPVRTTLSRRVSLDIPEDFDADQFCVELAVVDLQGRVSNYHKFCFFVRERVNTANPAPVANAGPDLVVLEGTASIELLARAFHLDGDIEAFAWRQLSGPSATLNGANTASLSFNAPQVAQTQTLVFELEITAADGQTATDAVRVTVLDTANHPPLAFAGLDRSVYEGATVGLLGGAGDVDGTVTVLWEQLSGPTVTIQSPAAISTSFQAPAVDTDQTVRLRLTATDDDGATASDAVDIRVIALNSVPLAQAGTFSATEDTALSASLASLASDEQGRTLSFEKAADARHGTLSVQSSGAFTYTPAANFFGIDSFQYQVRAGSSASLPATVRINVSGSNDAPAIAGTPATTATAGQAYAFQAIAFDVDGDALGFSVQNLPAWASFNTATGALTGTPGFDNGGSFGSIIISVTDGVLSTALPAFSISVSIPNRAPSISGTPATAAVAGIAYSFIPSASDPDGDALSFSITNKPSWASFDTGTGALTGTPPAAATHANIVISVSDGRGGTAALAAFTLTVTAAGSADAFAGDWHYVNFGTGINGAKRGNPFPFGRFFAFGLAERATITATSAATATVAIAPASQFLGGVDQLADGSLNYDVRVDAPAAFTTSGETFAATVSNGVLSVTDAYSTEFDGDTCGNCGSTTDLLRNLPSTTRLFLAGQDIAVGQLLYLTDAHVAADSDGDNTLDVENANRPEREDASLETLIFARQSASFAVSQLSGSYFVLVREFRVVEPSGQRETAILAKNWSFDGAGAMSQSAPFVQRRMIRAATSPHLTVQDGDVNTTDSGTVTANSDGSIQLVTGGQTLQGFASPDGELFVLGGVSGSGGTDGTVQQIIGLRKPGSTPNLNGNRFRLTMSNNSYDRLAAGTELGGFLGAALDISGGSFTVTGRESVHTAEVERESDNSLIQPFDEETLAEGTLTETGTLSSGTNGAIQFTADGQGDFESNLLTTSVNAAGTLLIGMGVFDEFTDAGMTTLSSSERGIVIGVRANADSDTVNNRAPRVSVAAANAVVGNGGTINLTATVNDPDNGPSNPTVTWHARAGSFSNGATGTDVVWTAPASGRGTIFLDAVASDGDRATLGSVQVTYGVPLGTYVPVENGVMDTGTTITILSDGTYIMGHINTDPNCGSYSVGGNPDTDASGSKGVEFGTYTFDPVTGNLSITGVMFDTTGSCGLAGDDPLPQTNKYRLTGPADAPVLAELDGNGLPLGSFQLQRIERGSGVVGSWYVDGEPTLPSVLTIYEDGTCFLVTITEENGSTSSPGVELATCSVDASNNFTVTNKTVDTNGTDEGLSNPLPTTLTVNAQGKLVFSDSNGSTTLSSLPLAPRFDARDVYGTWYGEGTGNNNPFDESEIYFVSYLPDGRFFLGTNNGCWNEYSDTTGLETSGLGVEAGRYAFDATTGRLYATSIVRDTEGRCGYWDKEQPNGIRFNDYLEAFGTGPGSAVTASFEEADLTGSDGIIDVGNPGDEESGNSSTFSLTKIPSVGNSLTGAWEIAGGGTGDGTSIVLIASGNSYALVYTAATGVDVGDSVDGGMEIGTFASSSNTFTFTSSADSTGEAGFSSSPSNNSVTLILSGFSFTYQDGNEDVARFDKITQP